MNLGVDLDFSVEAIPLLVIVHRLGIGSFSLASP